MTDEVPEAERNEAKRLSDLERIAFKTGEYRGWELDFSADGFTWAPVIPKGVAEHPAYARATTHRNGFVPCAVVIEWDDSIPLMDGKPSPSWLAHPHVLFGARARRASLRIAFRDVMPEFPPDEHFPEKPGQAMPEEAMSDRDWHAAVALTTDMEELDALWRDARTARVVDVPLDQAFKNRRRALQAPVLRAEMRSLRAQRADILGVAIDRLEAQTRPATVTPADVARALGASMTKRGDGHHGR